jgi:hypothetical protein
VAEVPAKVSAVIGRDATQRRVVSAACSSYRRTAAVGNHASGSQAMRARVVR